MKIKKVIKYYYEKIKILFFNKKNKQKVINYIDYVNLQKEKTLNPEKINKWLNEEWDIKLNGFKKMFSRHEKIIVDKKNALLLGSRTGQEVLAIQQYGIKAIGIDLVSFPPYTIEGDVHNMTFPDNNFDFCFTNIYDHILDPKAFVKEISRVMLRSGIFILHITIGDNIDKYSVNFVYDIDSTILLFENHSFKLLSKKRISNEYDSMNMELVFSKN